MKKGFKIMDLGLWILPSRFAAKAAFFFDADGR